MSQQQQPPPVTPTVKRAGPAWKHLMHTLTRDAPDELRAAQKSRRRMLRQVRR